MHKLRLWVNSHGVCSAPDQITHRLAAMLCQVGTEWQKKTAYNQSILPEQQDPASDTEADQRVGEAYAGSSTKSLPLMHSQRLTSLLLFWWKAL